MTDIVFRFDIEAPSARVASAIAGQDGIRGWWTEAAEVPDGESGVMRLAFAMAPAPFELRIDERSEEAVRWASIGAFPPHWAGTEIRWALAPSEQGGTTVAFRHAGFPSDEGMFGEVAFTWGGLMRSLKAYVEEGSTAGRLPPGELG